MRPRKCKSRLLQRGKSTSDQRAIGGTVGVMSFAVSSDCTRKNIRSEKVTKSRDVSPPAGRPPHRQPRRHRRQPRYRPLRYRPAPPAAPPPRRRPPRRRPPPRRRRRRPGITVCGTFALWSQMQFRVTAIGCSNVKIREVVHADSRLCTVQKSTFALSACTFALLTFACFACPAIVQVCKVPGRATQYRVLVHLGTISPG